MPKMEPVWKDIFDGLDDVAWRGKQHLVIEWTQLKATSCYINLTVGYELLYPILSLELHSWTFRFFMKV